MVIRTGKMTTLNPKLMNKAGKIGTKEYYFSRSENGKSNIHLSSVFKIIETCLGRKISYIIFM